MRKRKIVKINDKEFTVKELAVKDIREIWEEVGGEGDLAGIKKLVEQHMPKVTDATLEDFKNMTPSEIMELVDAFKEVNSAFFEMARSLGLGRMIEEIKPAIIRDFTGLYARSSKQDTPESGDTDSLPS